MAIGKKGQVYPVLMAIILLFSLTYAYFAIGDARRICLDVDKPCTSGSAEPYIGSKPNQIFFTIQDAESIKLFVDQSAKIATEKSMDEIEKGCTFKTAYDDIESEILKECGKHVYPLWSSKEELCLPNCTLSFKKSFEENLNAELSKYYLATKVAIPVEYDLAVDVQPGFFDIKGKSREQMTLNSYPVAKRQILESRPESLAPDPNLIRVRTEIRHPDAILERSASIAPQIDFTYKNIRSPITNPEILVDTQYFGNVPARIREQGKVTKIVLHHTGGSSVGAAVKTWAQSGGQSSSAHYVIDDDGKIYYIIDESYRANHAGCRESGERPVCRTWPPPANNDNSIGIEIINKGYSSDKYTKAQYDSIARLMGDIGARHGFAINDNNVFAHYEITDDKWDPSPNFDWAKVGLPNHNSFIRVAGGCADMARYGYGSICGSGITAAAIASTSSETPHEDASVPSEVDIYSFNTAFSVRVNKNMEDPLQEVTSWFEDTWNECTDDLKKCLDENIKEHNDQADKIYTLKSAGDCEDRPLDFFFDIMEAMEDALSNGQAGCYYEFNASSYAYDRDLLITFDGTTASLMQEEGNRMVPVDGATYTLFSGSFDSAAVPFKELNFSFSKDSYELERIIITGYYINDGVRSDNILSESVDLFRFVKILNGDQTDKGEFIAADNNDFPECLSRKEKYRLCAEPNPEYKSLFPVRFAMEFKDKPPSKMCEAATVEVIPETVKIDSLVEGIAEVKGFDIVGLFTSLPIPAFQLFGTYIGIADLVANLPSEQKAKLQVIVKNQDPDIVGYNVYCNDFPIELDINALESLAAPQSFAVIETQAEDLERQVTGLDKYVSGNKYAQFLDRNGCTVPTVDKSGIVRKVEGIKAVKDQDLTSFSVAQCGGAGVALDKLLDKDYCITLIPVDKQGREMRDCPITNCEKTNSLLKIAIKKFLESKLKNAMAIPAAEIPENMKPYFKLPDEDDFIDAALGRRSLDFSDIVDVEGAQGALAGMAEGFILKELNKELTGTALENTFNNLDDFQKQAVLSKISSEIKDEDARIIVNDLISGRSVSGDAQRIAMGRASDYIKDEKAKEVLSEMARSGDPQTAAFRAVQREAEKEFQRMSNDEKKKVIEKASRSRDGRFISEKVVDKAVQSGCVSSYTTPPATAVNCLNDKAIDEVYQEAFRQKDAAKALLASQIEDMDSEAAKAGIRAMSQTRDLSGAARAALMSEFESMPDSEKKDLLQDVMRNSGEPEKILQSQIMKRLPDIDNQFVSAILGDGNIQAILEDKLKDELTKQLGLFVNQKCEEPKK